MITEAARAKVNLYLQITGKREDGYHLLDSLVVFPDIGDRLEAVSADELSLIITGPFAASLSGDQTDNLVLKAARLLQWEAGTTRGARLHLDKRLPVASGIGGGSADAAACLRALNRLWELDWSEDRLAALALPLGADVPVCVYSRPARMEGIGEKITAIADMATPSLLLVNPGIEVPTPAIFQRMSAEDWSGRASDPLAYDALNNDLQAAAVSMAPVIGDVLQTLATLPGVQFARMSGSGATCFALFEDDAAMTEAKNRLQSEKKWLTLSGFSA